MPNRGFSKIPLENDNISMREIMDRLLERRKMKYRGRDAFYYGTVYVCNMSKDLNYLRPKLLQ